MISSRYVVVGLAVLAGCGQHPAVPVTVVNPPIAAKLLTAKDHDPQVDKWPNEIGVIYHTGRLYLAEKFLAFPNDPAEWSDAIFDDSQIPGQPPGVLVGGSIVCADKGGARVKRRWSYSVTKDGNAWKPHFIKLDKELIRLD